MPFFGHGHAWSCRPLWACPLLPGSTQAHSAVVFLSFPFVLSVFPLRSLLALSDLENFKNHLYLDNPCTYWIQNSTRFKIMSPLTYMPNFSSLCDFVFNSIAVQINRQTDRQVSWHATWFSRRSTSKRKTVGNVGNDKLTKRKWSLVSPWESFSRI